MYKIFILVNSSSLLLEIFCSYPLYFMSWCQKVGFGRKRAERRTSSGTGALEAYWCIENIFIGWRFCLFAWIVLWVFVEWRSVRYLRVFKHFYLTSHIVVFHGWALSHGCSGSARSPQYQRSYHRRRVVLLLKSEVLYNKIKRSARLRSAFIFV